MDKKELYERRAAILRNNNIQVDDDRKYELERFVTRVPVDGRTVKIVELPCCPLCLGRIDDLNNLTVLPESMVLVHGSCSDVLELPVLTLQDKAVIRHFSFEGG
jgi:hypothetical protein